MRSQPLKRTTKKRPPAILSEKTPKPTPEIVPSNPGIPLRIVNLVEVGKMHASQVQLIIQELNVTYNSAQGGIHYFLPIRNGKIGSDIVFEEEWEKIVRETCEVKDGEIKLKDGAQEIEIIRRKI